MALRRGCKSRLVGLLALLAAATFCLAGPAQAIVLHDVYYSEPLATPDDHLVGRWGGTASVVAVGSDWVLTTRHQGGNINTTQIQLGGVSYVIDTDHVYNIGGNDVDMRLVRITQGNGAAANLDHVELYTGTAEVGQQIVLGGFGLGRGGSLSFQHTSGAEVHYGYNWDKSPGNNNNLTQRWGANTIESVVNNFSVTHGGTTYSSNTLRFIFDDAANGVPYEAAMATRDSGGGWFINDNGTWKLVGINAYVETGTNRVDESWFRRNTFSGSNANRGDYNWAIRVSSYSQEIMGIMSSVPVGGVLVGDMNGDGQIDFDDINPFLLALNDPGAYETQYGLDPNVAGDINGDGQLDFDDINPFVAMLGGDASMLTIPEPATLSVLAIGGLAALARRRRR